MQPRDELTGKLMQLEPIKTNILFDFFGFLVIMLTCCFSSVCIGFQNYPRASIIALTIALKGTACCLNYVIYSSFNSIFAYLNGRKLKYLSFDF